MTTGIMKFDTDPAQSIEETLPTVESYTASRKQQQQQQNVAPPTTQPVSTDDPGSLEEEASQQGAFNPETGEINWDCPCLGGMAHGPCGEEFRSAFSCFVYSEQEPKGLDCIDKFKGMQDCFREHPEVYAAELEDDDPELEAELAQEREALQKNISTLPADQAQPQRRLLDDDSESTQLPVSPVFSPEVPPSKREAASQPSSSPQEARSSQKTPSSEPQPQPEPALAASTKDRTTSETPKETAEIAKQSTETSSQKFDANLELMPKPWHDTSDAKAPTEGEDKSKK